MLLKLTLITWILICSTAVFCQNWSPIQTTATSHYRISPEPVDSFQVYTGPQLGHVFMKTPFFSLWIDSFAQEGLDSIYYFNRNNYYTGYTLNIGYAHFLEKKMVKRGNGIYDFYSPDTFSIHSLANLNDSWEFHPTLSDTARVINVIASNVLGQIDSVKLILLSSGDTILLSQNYGIISFPDTSGIRYDLVGIEYDSIHYIGQKMPNVYDSYDFNNGDKFYYLSSQSGGAYFSSWKSDSFFNKQVTLYGYTYDVYNEYIANIGVNSIFNVSQTTRAFNYHPNLTIDRKNGEIYMITFSDHAVRVFEDYQGKLYKESGDNVTNRWGVVTSNCGLVTDGVAGFGFGSSNQLIGYVKNGVVVGDTAIWIHYTPTVPINKIEQLDLSIKVAPNPVNKMLYLSLEGSYQSENIQLKIVNLVGTVVRVVTKNWTNSLLIDVSDLPSGIYVLEVNAGAIREVQKIIIQQ